MILLTSQSCAPCKIVKAYIEENNLKEKINYVDIGSPDGRRLVQDNGIRSVPVLLTTSGTIVGQQPIMKLLKDIKEN